MIKTASFIAVVVAAAVGAWLFVTDSLQTKERYGKMLEQNQTYAVTQEKNRLEIERLQGDTRTWNELYEAINGRFDEKINALSVELAKDQAKRQAQSEQQMRELMETYKNDQESANWAIEPMPVMVRDWVQRKADQAAGIRE